VGDQGEWRRANGGGRAAIAAFRRAGWRVVRRRGSHAILEKAGKPNLVIPMHRAVAPFLLLSQVRRAGLTEKEFLALLR
jgi:predicted RNA binding protein YcfA (HicA-like mRNA interferase family)